MYHIYSTLLCQHTFWVIWGNEVYLSNTYFYKHIAQFLSAIYVFILISQQKMIRLLSQKGFKMSLYRNILVNDPSPLDLLTKEIPPYALRQWVSQYLDIPYLSKYEGNVEKLRDQVIFKGKMIGRLPRIFFSIPTALKNSQDYYYVHYLFDTSSPSTTLTHQALCCLFGKKYDEHVQFTQGIQCSIGGIQVSTNLSNPNPTEKNTNQNNYHNANRLGMNFFHQCTKFKVDAKFFHSKEAILELIPIK